MRKTISILLVGLMIVGMIGGYMQAIAQEGNEIEELMGLEVEIWYRNSSGAGYFMVQGILLIKKGNWLILKKGKNKYTWCYIPTIRYIDVLDKDYRPERRRKDE